MLKCSPGCGNFYTSPLQSKHHNRVKFIYDKSLWAVSTAVLLPPEVSGIVNPAEFSASGADKTAVTPACSPRCREPITYAPMYMCWI